MKKYNMPKMEISLFDAEVVSTNNDESTNLQDFTDKYNTALANGVARTITWKELELIW